MLGTSVMPTSGDFSNTAAVRIAGKARKFARFFSDSYRPELHYMRGPGPKWREKHGLPQTTAQADELGHPVLRKAGA
jgi:hypothetical protein